MGAAEFGNTAIAKTAGDAFHELQEQATYEHGHGGYTGTIAESPGFRMRADHPCIKSKAWVKWREDVLEQTDKWGECHCIEIKGKQALTIKHKRGFKGKRGYKVFYFFGCAPE